jgi:hypothetical protein
LTIDVVERYGRGGYAHGRKELKSCCCTIVHLGWPTLVAARELGIGWKIFFSRWQCGCLGVA